MSGSGPNGRMQTLGQLGDDVRTGAEVICAVCDKTDKLSRCSRCNVVFYCTKEHQRRDWKRHREFCATHPAATVPAEEPFSLPAVATIATNESLDREIPSKRHPSVGNCKAPKVVVPNLNLNKTSAAPRSLNVSNVTSESCRNVKHPAGMRARFHIHIVKLLSNSLSDSTQFYAVLRSKRILRVNDI